MTEMNRQKLTASSEFTSRDLRTALGKFATGVTVVTTAGEDGPVGVTVNSFSSVSLDPPLILWSLARTSSRLPVFEQASHFAVHVMNHQQEDLCRAFSRDARAFDSLSMRQNQKNIPIIEDCLACFECTRHAVHAGGDHLIFVGRVEAVTLTHTDPLIFFDSNFGAIEANAGRA